MPDQPLPETAPVIDLQPLLAIISAGDTEDRIALARLMGEIMSGPASTADDEHLRLALALGLAADPDVDVRHALALALGPVSGIDSDLLFAIVSDIDPIALPFLCATPSLTPWHMLAVLRAGDVARQACVALRPDLDPGIAEVITQELPWPVNQLLLENRAVSLSRPQYWTLHERFGDSPEAVDTLLAQPDLPVELRIVQARKASVRLRLLLAERRWLPARAAAALLADAEEEAILAALTAAAGQELADALSFMEENDLLTASLVMRAACHGAWDVVAAALAALADLPVAGLDFAPARLKALIARAGLPDACLWTLRAAHDVDAAERQDVFRLTEDEFGQQMIERLLEGYNGMRAEEQGQSLDLIARFASPAASMTARQLLETELEAA
jgi:uncharacterized protein (DUF2336 family)